MLLGHVHTHEGTQRETIELTTDTLHEHLRWTESKVRYILGRARAMNLVTVRDDIVHITERGEKHMQTFLERNLARIQQETGVVATSAME